MKLLGKLTLIQLKHLLSINTSAGKKKRKTTSIGLLLLGIAALSLYVGVTYAFTLASTLNMVGAVDLLFVLMSAIGTLFGAILTLYGVSGLVYQAKDISFLMSLPLKPRTILTAKLLAIYGEAFIVNFFMLVPAVIAYSRYANLPITAYPLLLLVLFLLPLLATSLALIFGYIFSFVQAKTKALPIVTNGFALILFAGLMYFSFNLQNTFFNNMTASTRDSLATYAMPFYWVRNILIDGDMLSLIYLALVSIVPLVGLIWLISSNYLNMVTMLSARGKSSDYRGPSQKKSPLSALLRKEFKQYFNSPAYFINTILGPILLIGAPIYLILQRSKLPMVTEVLDMINFPIGTIAIISLIGMISFNNTTAPSISLEGNRLWILKTLPVSTWDIFKAKLLLNMILFVPAILFAAIVLNFLFDFTIGERILVFVIPLLASLASAMVGLIANLIYPKLDAPSDTAAVKNSASVLIGSLGYMVATLALMALLFGLRDTLGNALIYVMLAIYLIFNFILYRYLRTKGEARFNQLI